MLLLYYGSHSEMSLSESLLLPQRILNRLKCDNCSLYLSVPPIKCRGKKLICGRCIDEMAPETNTYRAKAFENVASLLSFPCRYVKDGCSKQDLAWKLVENHESSCSYQPRSCPLKDCTWQVNAMSLPEHFTLHHEDLMLNPEHVHQLPPLDSKTLRLVLFKDTFFLMYIVPGVVKGEQWFGIYLLRQYEDDEREFFYNLKFLMPEDNSGVTFSDNTIHNYEWKFPKSKALKLNVDYLGGVLKSQEMFFKIYIVDKFSPITAAVSQEKISNQKLEVCSSKILGNVKMQADLKCPVCKKYMVPPIFMCPNNHTLCGECNGKISTCPTCKTLLSNTQNYSLQRLAQNALYFCKNEGVGCKFVGKCDTFSSHYEMCHFKKIECPLKNAAGKICHWTGTAENCFTHVIFGKHNGQIWKGRSKTITRNLSSNPAITFEVLSYEGRLFRICCKHSLRDAGSISWSFQEIGLRENERSSYKFEIEFFDPSGKRKFVMDAVCLKYSKDKDAFGNSSTVPYSLLVPFIDGAKNLVFNCKIRRI